MNSPKEEAIKLMTKFSKYAQWDDGFSNNDFYSANCALKAVDELISSHNKWDDNAQWNTEEYYFYLEVKRELEEIK